MACGSRGRRRLGGGQVRGYIRNDRAGTSAFALEDGVVSHTYSAYGRGVTALWGMYPWLNAPPKGGRETRPWWRRHDECDKR